MTILPDPGIGRNPPRYQKLIPIFWGQRYPFAAFMLAILVAGAIYYIFAV